MDAMRMTAADTSGTATPQIPSTPTQAVVRGEAFGLSWQRHLAVAAEAMPSTQNESATSSKSIPKASIDRDIKSDAAANLSGREWRQEEAASRDEVANAGPAVSAASLNRPSSGHARFSDKPTPVSTSNAPETLKRQPGAPDPKQDKWGPAALPPVFQGGQVSTAPLGAISALPRDVAAMQEADVAGESSPTGSRTSNSLPSSSPGSQSHAPGESIKGPKTRLAPVTLPGGASVDGKQPAPAATSAPVEKHSVAIASAASGRIVTRISSDAEDKSSNRVSDAIHSATQNAAVQTAVTNQAPSSLWARSSPPSISASIPRAAEAASPHVVASSPAQIDVGVFDGTHGWLRIRAELDGAGTVSASLIVSASGHASLRSAIPEMVSYLGSEAISVSRIALHRLPENSSFTSAADARQNNTASEGRNQEQPHSQKRHLAMPDQSDSSAAIANVSSGPDRQFNRVGASSVVTRSKLAQGWSFAGLGRSNGNWLNVCA